MQLWLLEPNDPEPWDPWYDKAFAFVVRAETEQDARNLAESRSGDESRYEEHGAVWLDESLVTCKPLTDEGEAEVVVRDFARA